MQKTIALFLICCAMHLASAQAKSVQKLDSVILLGVGYQGEEIANEKKTYTYNAQGDLIFEIHYRSDEHNTVWIPMTKYNYEYDAYGRNTSMLSSSWEIENGEWENFQKSVRTYHASGGLETELNYTWDIFTKDWVHGYSDKWVYTYKEGRIASISLYDWDPLSNELTNRQIHEYIYDIFAYSIIGKLWIDSNWVVVSRYDYVTDTHGNILSGTGYDKLPESSSSNPTWLMGSKDEYTYNENHDKTTHKKYRWDGRAWHNTHEYAFSYDAQQRFVKAEVIVWGTGEFVTSTKIERIYDPEDATLIIPFHIAQDPELSRIFKHKLLRETRYDYVGEFEDIDFKKYYFSPLVLSRVGETPIIQNNMTLYPNPTENAVKVAWATDFPSKGRLEIYNLTGILVKQLDEVSTQQEISVAELPSGMYTYKLIGDGLQVQGTLVKK